MGTGSVALNVVAFPYTFAPSQFGIALFFWSIAAFLALLFTLLTFIRAIFYPRTLRILLVDLRQALFLSCVPMGIITVNLGIPSIVGYYLNSEQFPAAANAAVVLYWIALPLTFLAGFTLPFVMFYSDNPLTSGLHKCTGAWLLPVVPAVVLGFAAGSLCSNERVLAALSSNTIHALLISGYVFAGIGVLLSYSIATQFMQRLMLHSIPPREQVVSSFLPTGAMANAALAFLRLGQGCEIVLLKDLFGLSNPSPGPQLHWREFLEAADGVGPIFAYLLWAFACWWWFTAIASLLTTLRSLPFNLGWWGGLFPTGSLASATIALGNHVGSDGLKGIGAAIAVLQVGLWFVVAGFTLNAAWVGSSTFLAPCLTDLEGKNCGPPLATLGGKQEDVEEEEVVGDEEVKT